MVQPYLSGCGPPAVCPCSWSGTVGLWTSCWGAGGGAGRPQAAVDWGLVAEESRMPPRTCRPRSPWTALRSGRWRRWGHSEGLCPGGVGHWRPPSWAPAWWRSVAPGWCGGQPARSKGRRQCESPGREPTEGPCWWGGPGSPGSGTQGAGAAGSSDHVRLIPSWSRGENQDKGRLFLNLICHPSTCLPARLIQTQISHHPLNPPDSFFHFNNCFFSFASFLFFFFQVFSGLGLAHQFFFYDATRLLRKLLRSDRSS